MSRVLGAAGREPAVAVAYLDYLRLGDAGQDAQLGTDDDIPDPVKPYLPQ